MNLMWMRRDRSRITHAFAERDLSRFETVEPLGPGCGWFPVVDLQEDELAERCVVCERAVRALR